MKIKIVNSFDTSMPINYQHIFLSHATSIFIRSIVRQISKGEEISSDFKRSHRRVSYVSCTIKFPKSSAKQEARKALTYFMDVDLNFKSFVWFTLD